MSTTASDQAIAISVFAAQDLYYHVAVNPAIGIFTYVFLCELADILSDLCVRMFVRSTKLAFANFAG